MGALLPEIQSTLLEQDLVWFFPSLIHQFKDQSLLDSFLLIIQPSLWYGDPLYKLYFWVGYKIFGAHSEGFVFIAVWLHIINAIVLERILHALQLPKMVCLYAALIYLSFFGHFHAYLWPMAFQHLSIVFFILIGFKAYQSFSTAIEQKTPLRKTRILMFIVHFFASLCRVNIVLLPFIMGTHLFFCSASKEDFLKKYNRCFPFFLLYLGQPLASLFFAGDNRLGISFSPSLYPVFVCSGLAFLLGFRFLVQYAKIRMLYGMFWAFLGIGIMGYWIHHPSLLYAFWIPWIGCLQSFLEPLSVVKTMASTIAYHKLPIDISLGYFFFSAFLLLIFIKLYICRWKSLLILAPWYVFCFFFLKDQNPIASRYFIYLSPIAAICLACVYHTFSSWLFSTVSMKKRGVLFSTLLLLCFVLFNIMAIKFSLFKNKLVNQLCFYNDLYLVSILEKELGNIPTVNQKTTIYIQNILPMPYQERGLEAITPLPHDDFFHFKNLLASRLKTPFPSIQINNPAPIGNEKNVYDFLNGELKKGGQPIDPFWQLLQQVNFSFSQGNIIHTKSLIKKTLTQRPFFIRYLLNELPIHDLYWIAGNESLHHWLNHLERTLYKSPYPLDQKRKLGLRMMQHDLEGITRALLIEATLAFIEKDTDTFMHSVSQLKYLEEQPEILENILLTFPLKKYGLKPHLFLSHFSKMFMKVSLETDRPYAFEHFCLRLLMKYSKYH